MRIGNPFQPGMRPVAVQNKLKPANVRFGQAHFFTEKDVVQTNPKLIEAFKTRFPTGSRMVAASGTEDYVWVYDVIANTGDKIILQNPMSRGAEVTSLTDHKNLFQSIVMLNLPLINEENNIQFGKPYTPEEGWVKAFRDAVDMVKEEDAYRHRSLVQPNQLGPQDQVVYPAGFNLKGELFCLYKKDYVPGKQPPIKPLDGSPKAFRSMFLALTPESMWNKYLALEKQDGKAEAVTLGQTLAGFRPPPPDAENLVSPGGPGYKKAFWDAVFNSLALTVLEPKDLQRIDARGEYEQAPLLYSPAEN